MDYDHLVSGIPTLLKNMSSSIGMIIPFPTEWKNNIHVPVTTNQSSSPTSPITSAQRIPETPETPETPDFCTARARQVTRAMSVP